MARKINSNVFVEISNQAIYDKVLGVDIKLEALSKKLDDTQVSLDKKVMETSDALKTQIEQNRAERELEIEKLRGILVWHQWLIIAAIGVSCFAVTLLVQHVMP